MRLFPTASKPTYTLHWMPATKVTTTSTAFPSGDDLHWLQCTMQPSARPIGSNSTAQILIHCSCLQYPFTSAQGQRSRLVLRQMPTIIFGCIAVSLLWPHPSFKTNDDATTQRRNFEVTWSRMDTESGLVQLAWLGPSYWNVIG